MKKFTTILAILALCPLFVGTLWAGENFKLRVEGPEAEYNLVRVTNNSQHQSLECTVYLLDKNGEKYTVRSAVGTYHVYNRGDTDSNKIKLRRGDWLGVVLPEGIENVSCIISYMDLPFFDVVDISIIDGSDKGYSAGQEF